MITTRARISKNFISLGKNSWAKIYPIARAGLSFGLLLIEVLDLLFLINF
jgi:hypothetical protein